MYAGEKDKKKVSKTKNKSSKDSKLALAKKQAMKAGAAVLETRRDIKKLSKEPKGHFNKNIIGDPNDTAKGLRSRLDRQVKKRDSLRGVVRKFKK